MADAPLIDIWSGLDHKIGMGEGSSGGINAAPEWLDTIQARRFNAYARIAAMLETVGRFYLEDDPNDPEKTEAWLEFGDPAIIVGRQAHAVLGEKPLVVVEGADDPLPDQPDIPTPPTAPEDVDGRDPVVTNRLREAYEAALAVWDVNAEEIVARWIEDVEESPRLLGRQAWLRDWAKEDSFIGKVTENELENIVPFGSGVYVLGWDAEKRRVTTEIYEPNTYYPILDDATPSTFPSKVHLAWQYIEVDPDTGEESEWVRRITYELVPIIGPDADPGVEVGSRPLYLGPDDQWTHTCLQSDGRWPLDAFETVNGLAAGVQWEQVQIGDGDETADLNRWPIGLDFMPLVMVPNSQSSATHFGRSPLVRMTQLFDELQATDTDEALASRWAARPPVGISGMPPGETEVDVTPGKGWRLGEHGAVSAIDMAGNLEKVSARLKELLKRVSVNGQVPEGLLGRVDASEVPSGLALTLSFTSFEQLVDGMRLARGPKYSLILKMVQRIAIQNGDETIGESVYPAAIQFGAFMPQDLAGIAGVLKSLRDADLLSQETGLRMARDAGVPSEDLRAELVSIRAGQAAVADLLTAALEDPRYAAEFLGVDYRPPAAPDADVPPAVPDGGLGGAPQV